MISSILAPSFLPISAVLEMTYKCNHTCLFCSCPWEAPNSEYATNKEQTIEQWKQSLEKLVEMGVISFSFTGGEPFLKEGIFEIIEFASGLKARHIDKNLNETLSPPNLFVISNGQLIDKSTLEFIKKHNIQLSLSLPGLETYKQHTGSGNPQKILDLFSMANELGITTTANISVTKINFFELEETISYALLAGASNILLNRFLPGGRGLKHVDELLLSSEQVENMLITADSILRTANRNGSVGTELPLCLVLNKKFTNLRVGTRCSAAKDFFVLSPDGHIRTCNHSPVKLEHISEIEKLKHNPYWKHFVFREYHPQMCESCTLISNCDGGCREAAHVYRGKLTSNDPLFDGNRKVAIDIEKR
ncbi:MAG: radical SAM protein [Bacteroidales bacterium]|nr:radical SAM protein [Bacteroidales bacterium]